MTLIKEDHETIAVPFSDKIILIFGIMKRFISLQFPEEERSED